MNNDGNLRRELEAFEKAAIGFVTDSETHPVSGEFKNGCIRYILTSPQKRRYTAELKIKDTVSGKKIAFTSLYTSIRLPNGKTAKAEISKLNALLCQSSPFSPRIVRRESTGEIIICNGHFLSCGISEILEGAENDSLILCAALEEYMDSTYEIKAKKRVKTVIEETADNGKAQLFTAYA